MALRVGLIGRGRWGRNIERTLKSFPDVTVGTFGRGDKPPAGVDAVLIATPSATHAELALPYIEAGVPTFIEKPMTTSVADADRLMDAARRSGAPVFVGHIFLYHPAFAALLALLPKLGAIRSLLCEGMNDAPRTDSSVLWDWLPHDLSMAREIFGQDATRVEAWSLDGGDPPPVAATRFTFAGVPVTSVLSWKSPTRRKLTTILCENGTLVFDDKAERRLALHGRNGEVSYPAYDSELPLTRELRAFLKMVRDGAPDAAHLETGHAVVRMIAAAEQSIRAGGKTVPL